MSKSVIEIVETSAGVQVTMNGEISTFALAAVLAEYGASFIEQKEAMAFAKQQTAKLTGIADGFKPVPFVCGIIEGIAMEATAMLHSGNGKKFKTK